MKKNTLIILVVLFIGSISAQQRQTIYITTKLPIKFKTYIDDELQLYVECAQIKILNVPKGEKKLKVRVMTPSDQQSSITIGKSIDKDEYYRIEKVGETYVLKANPEGAKDDKTYYSRASYIPKPKTTIKDTSLKSNQTCHLTDSALNKIIIDISSIKDVKARKNLAQNLFKSKCLYTHQIKSIGYRIDDDEQRFALYQVLFLPALDRNKFSDLTNSFQSQLYANKFMNWFNDQKY
jgi:hypothetical protein